MKQAWLKNTLPIATIFSFRMLGLFMLIPVFTIYATHLVDATPTLIGIALGGYGLSQGILQIPFGMMSDRYGRKLILVIGLVLFVSGSLLGAFTHSIYGMIIARILQGAGAIGSVLIALLADLTPDEHRTKAMAIIGVTIGLSFSLAIVISPVITTHFGLAGIFYLTAFFALLGLLMVYFIIPNPVHIPFDSNSRINTSQFKQVIRNSHLLRSDAGIFFLHLMLTSTFFAIPMLLQQQIKQGHLGSSWHFYLPLMCISFLIMVPFIVLAERKQKIKWLFTAAIGIIALAQWSLAYSHDSLYSLFGLMFLYFVSFNILEASLPSLVSKQAHISSRGCAMGIYSSSQFLGIFVGGTLSGFIFQWLGFQGIFIMNGCVASIWLVIASFMQPLNYQFAITIPFPNQFIDPVRLKKELTEVRGVCDIAINTQEKLIYLQVEKALYLEGSAEEMIKKITPDIVVPKLVT
ncbi:MAG: MFS transporter [Legionellaceae bacterium]|nr:MFS transporter [Legionellaceae bacterium]